MKRTVESLTPPENKQVMWLDVSGKVKQLKTYINGEWVIVNDDTENNEGIVKEILGKIDKDFESYIKKEDADSKYVQQEVLDRDLKNQVKLQANDKKILLYLCSMKRLVFVMLTILMLSACRTTTRIVEVPVEVIKKEYIHDTKIDSVYIRDSVDRWQKGDTLYITKWHTKFKYINKVDTLIKTDSIPKIVSVEKKVEVNHIYWYQKLLMWLWSITIILLIIVITYRMKK